MQQAEIKYTGMTTRPSDYDCPDGDIAVCVNLINENGSLLPVTIPESIFTCQPNEAFVHIHKNAGYENYIFLSADNNIAFSSSSSLSTARKAIYQFDHAIQVKSISSMGNMLLILTSDGIYYALFSNNNYIWLGNKLPELPNFEIRRTENSGWRDFDKAIVETRIGEKFNGEWYNERGQTNSWDTEEAYILNEFFSIINTESEKAYATDCFIFPFFIRLAYRMYDGSLVCHSAPILLLSDQRDISLSGDGFIIGANHSFSVKRLYASGFIPNYFKIIFEPSFEMGYWKELITSIDIYMSQPLYTLNMGATKFSDIIAIVTKYGDNRQPLEGHSTFTLKDAVTPEDFLKKVKENSLFYKVETIKTESLNEPDGLSYSISSEYLRRRTLVTQEVMSDDYRSRSTVYAEGVFVYNNRVNVFNIKTSMFKGFQLPMFDIAQYSPKIERMGETVPPKLIGYQSKISDTGNTEVSIFIKSNVGTTAIVKNNMAGTYKLPRFFYYPEAKAYRAVFTSGGRSVTIPLETHNGLNGSQYVNTNFAEEEITGAIIEVPETEKFIYTTNEIKTSEVNNPMSYKASNVMTVGNGTILDISSATKALSQGQFGQFPLYVFTDEGVWAVEVSQTGTYSAKQPTTRDVCNNVDSIVQLDGSIAFTTNQGVMLLAGSESICISTQLTELVPFETDKLQSFNSILEKVGMQSFNFKYIPFREYLKGSMMAYDYPNSRLVVFNPNQPYSYMYNLENKTWATINRSFSAALNSYPDSFLRNSSGEVVNISAPVLSQKVNGLIVTRPLKLGQPDILKTITQAIHRGVFARGKVKTVLYGSRDGLIYTPVSSSTDHHIRSTHGSPYKYFRFVIIAKLDEGESISGTSIIYEPKHTNKLR